MADNSNAIAEMLINIRARAEGLEQSVDEIKAQLNGIGNAVDKTKKPLKEAGQAGKDAGKDIGAGAQEAQLAWLALAAAAIAAFRKIREAVNQGVADVNAYKDALKGLNSVADYVGVSHGEIEEATAKVTNEFFNAEAAATSLKNLLLRGYSLDQAVRTIQSLSDAAAYGRQASLTLSDAVKSATEGLKNENSILVDNAGVTKNVAKMWEEYAKQRGISTAAMTQAQKVEAEYLGIQQETAAMTGDLASLQDTLSGKMAQTKNQAYLLSKAFGEANTQLKAAETDLKNGLLKALTELVETYPSVTAGATTATGALLGMMAISKVITLLKTFQTQLLAINASLGPLGIAALAIGAAATAYTVYKRSLEQAVEEEEKRIQQNKEAVKAQQDRVDTLETLISRYAVLKRKQSINYSEAVELKSIENQLSEQYGITKGQVDELAKSTDDYTQSIKNLTQAEREKLLLTQEQQAADAKTSAQTAMQGPLKEWKDLRAATDQWIAAFGDRAYDENDSRWLDMESINGELAGYQSEIDAAMAQYTAYVDAAMAAAETDAVIAGKEWKDTIASTLSDAMMLDIDPSQFEDAGAITDYLDAQIALISDAASSPGMTEAIDALQGIWNQVEAGAAEIDTSGMEQAIGKIDALWEAFGSRLGMTKEEFVAAISPINYLTGSLDDLKTSLEAQAAANRDEMFTAGESAQANTALAESLGEAATKYEELKNSRDGYYNALTGQENKSFAIQDWLADSDKFKAMSADTEGYAETLASLISVAAELGYVFDGTPEDLQRITDAVNLQAAGLADTAEDLESVRAEIVATINELLRTEGLPDDARMNLNGWLADLDESMARIEGLEDFSNFFDGYKERFGAALDAAKEDILDTVGGSWSDELADGLSLAMRYALGSMGIEDPELGEQIVTALIDSIAAAASDEAVADAMETITAFTEAIQNGLIPDEEATDAFIEAWETMLGEDSPIITGLQGLVESGEITAEQMEEFRETIESLYDPLGLLGDIAEETAGRVADAASLYGDAKGEISDTEKALKEYQKTLKGVQSGLKSTTAMTQQIKAWKGLYAAYKEAKKNGKDAGDIIKDMTPYIKKMTGAFDGSEDAIENTNDAFADLGTYAAQRVAELQNQITSLEQELWELDATDPNVDMTGDAALLIAAIAAAKDELLELLALMAEAGITSTGSGGGGRGSSGGGGAAEVTKSAYEKEIDHLEHLKALDQLTYEQELENLENIAARRIADAEERLDLEERIYEVKKAIAERDAENLTDLTDAIIDALEERYDRMRETELVALEDSRDAWEEWRDHNVQAIQDQIDALDALEEAEDNEADREERLRKIAMLEQSLAYEQDAYNQMQLQKQLDSAREDYEDFLSDLEREEQKSALEAAIDAINKKADSEIGALDEQQEAIEAYYDERMTAANLQAEAELELVNSTQQQILDLLVEYAPEYDAAGRTWGERLMEGFTSVFGSFNDWFADFEAKVTGAVDSIQAANVAAAAARTQAYDENGNPVSGITINQQNTFNTPVETPAETARRIQQANEDLAEQIAGE